MVSQTLSNTPLFYENVLGVCFKMRCIYIKQKLDRTLFCKKKNKIIKFSDCANCKFKEYNEKCTKNQKNCALHSNKPYKMRNKSAKSSKLERNRKSILTNDLNHCIICGAKKDHLHEIFFGKNRLASMKYDLVIPLCFRCHTEMHNNIEWQNYWHKKGQLAFMKSYPGLDFIDIFKINYLNIFDKQ